MVSVMLKEISFRLGMNGALYLGICIGCMISGILFLTMVLLFDMETILLVSVTAGLVIAAIILIALIIYAQNRRRKAKEDLCTCRYRSSVYTVCRECAYKEKSEWLEKNKKV